MYLLDSTIPALDNQSQDLKCNRVSINVLCCFPQEFRESGQKEKGESDLTAGKSLVYGVMEICMCVLTRQLPALVPPAPSTTQPPGVLLSVSGTPSKGKLSE